MPNISAKTSGSSMTDVEDSLELRRERTHEISNSTIEVGDNSYTALRDNTTISESVMNYKDDFAQARGTNINERGALSTNLADSAEYIADDVCPSVEESISVPSSTWVKPTFSQLDRVDVSERLDQIASATDKLLEQEVFHSLEDTSNMISDIQSEGRSLKEQESEIASELDDDMDWLDVLGNGDILKRVIIPGEEKTRPDRGQIVTVNLKAHLESDLEVESEKNLKFTVGDADVVQGLELAIPLMNRGEKAKIAIRSRFAYGALGREPHIPPDSTIIYTIELLDVCDEPDMESLPLSDKIKIGTEKKERGNFWFARGDFSQAVVCYRRALDFLDDGNQPTTAETPERLQEILEDRLKVYNNLALAQLKLDAFDAAMKSVDHVLRVQPQNVKALFRKGKIFAAQGSVDDAIKYMKKALKLEPEMKIIHQELARLTAKKTHENYSERELYRKMLGEQRHTPEKKRSKSHFKFWGSFLGGLAAVVIGVVVYRQYHGGW